jgi:multisubunit Na+/H+ antiporter MnhB subunit
LDVDLYLTVLLAFMLIGAIVAVETRDLLSAVIAVGTVGFATSLGFLLLGSPDLAITQVVVEIIILVVLIRATVVRDETIVYRHRDTFAIAAGFLALGALLIACLGAYSAAGRGRGLSPFGNPTSLRPYAEPPRGGGGGQRGVSRLYLDESWRALSARERTARAAAPGRARAGAEPFDSRGDLHVPNRVTAIILDYRGYDTLGEATVILTAIVGALVILRRRGRVEGEA